MSNGPRFSAKIADHGSGSADGATAGCAKRCPRRATSAIDTAIRQTDTQNHRLRTMEGGANAEVVSEDSAETSASASEPAECSTVTACSAATLAGGAWVNSGI